MADQRPTPDSLSEPGGFAALYAAEHTRLVRTAFLLTGSRAVAEDLAHDAFVRARGRLEGVERPGAYLQVTVANLCKRYLRRQGTEAKAYLVMARWRRDRAEPTGDHIFDSLSSLTAPQRAVLVLRYYLDLSDAEIADALGCPESTVRSHAARGLAQLRKVVEQ